MGPGRARQAGVVMSWVNPLDRLPQIPQDYANHICYGGVLGLALMLCGLTSLQSMLIVLAVSASKKIVDFFKESETLGMCFAKTFVTAFFPFAFFVSSYLK